MTDPVADQKIIVIGAGQAGFAACAKLRALGHTGPLTLIGAEPHPPYQRPPLSKGYVLGDVARERLFFRPLDFYAAQGIGLQVNARAIQIDRDVKQVILADGRSLAYDKLILATGATPLRLPQAVGGTLGGVHYMRDLADADRLSQSLSHGRRVVIVGGGYIGLEAAAVAAKRGLRVTLIEAGARILNRVAAIETANFFRDLHTKHGVVIREDCRLAALLGQGGNVTAAQLDNGDSLSCDLVIVGIGVRPNQELAQSADLAIENGIRTDAQCRSSDPAIFAVGDCASFPWQGAQIRLESVGNAIDQAEIAAAVIMGHAVHYSARPWFWSDQYDVKLQIAGLSQEHDAVVVREAGEARSHWYYAADRLVAVDALNDPRGYMIAKRLIEAGVSPAKSEVANPAFDVKELLTTLAG